MNRDALVDAVDLLQDKGIVEATDFGKARNNPKRTFIVTTRPWQDVAQSTDAMELLKRLRVSRDCLD